MSVAKKLRLQQHKPLYLLKASTDIAAIFSGYDIKTALSGKQLISQAVIFAENKRTLDELIPKVNGRLDDGALLWVAYHKKSGKIKSEITRDNG